MKGFELVKREDHWDLYNEDGHKIAATIDGCNSKLSIKNCEAIANGYDLDELSSKKYPIENTGAMFMPNRIEVTNIYRQEGFIEGAKAILEILGDKKFSEEDMLKSIAFGWDYEGRPKEEMLEIHNVNLEYNNSYFEDTQKYIQSLQQTEWDVEIVTKDTGLGARINREHKLDRDSCLILKRI
jgi:hypothetical protein